MAMTRIVIEVDEKLARSWRSASEEQRRKISNIINASLAKEMYKEASVKDYQDFLQQLRSEMNEKGLTQEELDHILENE